MSANADSTLRGFAAFSRGDFDEALAEVDPEIEWHLGFRLPDLPPDQTVFRGVEQIRTLWETLLSVWEELSLEPEEVLYDADDTLVTRVRFTARGGASGAEVERVFVYVQTMRDGLLLSQRPFDTEEEAFSHLGVERE